MPQVKLKIRRTSSYDTLYPETTVDAVQGLNSALSTINASLAGKQDTLVSGTNIKTVGGVSLLGSGDIDVMGSSVLDTAANAPTPVEGLIFFQT